MAPPALVAEMTMHATTLRDFTGAFPEGSPDGSDRARHGQVPAPRSLLPQGPEGRPEGPLGFQDRRGRPAAPNPATGRPGGGPGRGAGRIPSGHRPRDWRS